ncbi:ornithine carbamoyltransferase [halophilic archaeon]|nr:ornithine carbamoyltransferase [halophilic archaeon]
MTPNDHGTTPEPQPSNSSPNVDADPAHFLTVDDLSEADLRAVVDSARAFERARADGESHAVLPGATATMLFEKPSTRTRVSFETGMTHLGGHAVFLGPDDTQLDRGEPVSDTARVLSRYGEFVVARVFDHGTLETMAEHATVPVVNALSDFAHPCQALADLLALRQRFGSEAHGASERTSGGDPRALSDLSVTWVGDGNNVAASFVVAAATMGVDVTVATPQGYELPADVLERAAARGPAPEVVHDPESAVEGADAVYTDVWVSMGDEDEREEKLTAFEGFQVNADLLARAPDAAVMHCLPAHRGEEITGDALESERSLAWQQAENRLHVQKALLAHLGGAEYSR